VAREHFDPPRRYRCPAKEGGELNKNRGFFDIMEHLRAARSKCASFITGSRIGVKPHEYAWQQRVIRVINNFYMFENIVKNIVQNPTVSKHRPFWAMGLSKHSNQIQIKSWLVEFQLILDLRAIASKNA
jgi:hypothetical protein